MSTWLVVPSNREKHLQKFLSTWQSSGGWDEVCVVEDGPTKTFDITTHYHVSWKEIEGFVGDDVWVFSRRDSAIRCFGFLMAWRLGADHVLTLDDDCLPLPWTEDFAGQHVSALEHPVWAESVPGARTRGLPYMDRGTLHASAHMGLWEGVADLDAVGTLSGADPSPPMPRGRRLIPNGQLFPVCGMNLSFTRDVLPLFYFPRMGEGSPFSRFDDIWAGILAKRMMDHLGLHFSIGEPHVHHARASDPLINLVKEAPGISANETFWRTVLDVRLTGSTPLDAVESMGAGLSASNDAYISQLGRALLVWKRLLS